METQEIVVLYQVEVWSNEKGKDPHGCPVHIVSVVHVNETREGALQFCHENVDMCGDPGDNWFLWHFRIRTIPLNRYSCALSPCEFTSEELVLDPEAMVRPDDEQD